MGQRGGSAGIVTLCALCVTGFPALSQEISDRPKQLTLMKIRVSKETTRLTKPGPNGFPDYASHLRSIDSKGVTPQNNLATVLIQLMRHSIGDRLRDQLAEEFSFTADAAAPQLKRAPPFWEDNEFAKQLSRCQGPWVPDARNKRVASWLEDNRNALSILDDALIKRDRLFCVTFNESRVGAPSMLSYHSPATDWVMQWGSLIQVRSMLRLGTGDAIKAASDVERLLKLAVVCQKSSDDMMWIAASHLRRIAFDAAVAISMHPDTKPATRARLQRMVEVTKVRPIADYIDSYHRFKFLDGICQTTVVGPVAMFEAANTGRRPTASYAAAFAVVDWNQCLKDGNRFFDNLADAARVTDHAERAKRLEDVMDGFKGIRVGAVMKMQALGTSFKSAGLADATIQARVSHFSAAVETELKRMTATVSDMFLSTTTHGIVKAPRLEDHATARREMAIAAIACCRYREANGNFPKTLAELVPAYLAKVPLDPHSAKNDPIGFLVSEQFVSIYSVSSNRKDDTKIGGGGKNVQPDDWGFTLKKRDR